MKKVVTPKRSLNTRPKKSLPVPPPALKIPATVAQRLQADKEPVSYWHKYRYYVLCFVAALALFALCVVLVKSRLLQAQEIRVFHRINNLSEKFATVFAAVTWIGSAWAPAVVVALAFVLRLYQLAWRLALSTFTAFGLVFVIKHFFERLRPEHFISNVHVRVAEDGFAFPSGHATFATVLALTVRSYWPVPAFWQWAITMFWIGSVGFSRVYLGVHSPLDIVAGFAVGVGVVCFWRLVPKFAKKLLRLK